MAVAIQSNNIETVNTTEALWSLIVNQKKSVQKVIASRLENLLSDEKRRVQENYVRDSLTSAIKEVRESCISGESLPDARNLFDDLDD